MCARERKGVRACVRACVREVGSRACMCVASTCVRACVRELIREASAWAGGHKYANGRTGQAGGLPGGRAGQGRVLTALSSLILW